MKAEKKSFVIYHAFYAPISRLTDEQLGRLFRAIFIYQIEGIEDVADDLKMPFYFFKNQFEIDREKYAAVCAARSAAGKKGGRPNEKQKKQKKQMLLKKAKEAKEAKKADNENENENDNDNEKGKINTTLAPASPEEKEFAAKMRETYPTLCTLERPLTCEEMKKLIDANGAARVKNVLQDMENYTGITKKRSVYLTAIKWIRTDER